MLLVVYRVMVYGVWFNWACVFLGYELLREAARFDFVCLCVSD